MMNLFNFFLARKRKKMKDYAHKGLLIINGYIEHNETVSDAAYPMKEAFEIAIKHFESNYTLTRNDLSKFQIGIIVDYLFENSDDEIILDYYYELADYFEKQRN